MSTFFTRFPILIPSCSDREIENSPGRIERLNQRDNQLACMLESKHHEKLAVLQSRPLKIGVVGFFQIGYLLPATFTIMEKSLWLHGMTTLIFTTIWASNIPPYLIQSLFSTGYLMWLFLQCLSSVFRRRFGTSPHILNHKFQSQDKQSMLRW